MKVAQVCLCLASSQFFKVASENHPVCACACACVCVCVCVRERERTDRSLTASAELGPLECGVTCPTEGDGASLD